MRIRRSVVCVALCSVLCGAALVGCSLQTTGAIKGNLHLRAQFNDVQNLVAGEAVEVADVQVGSVISIRLTGYQPTVTMAIKSKQKIPVGTVAVLNQVSLLGEQYIDLHFPAHFDPNAGPWVKSGDQLPTSSTQGVEQFVNQASNLVGAIDAGDLAASFQALDEGLAGRGPALNQIIASLTQVAHAINGQSGDLATIIDGLGKLGTPLANGSNQIGALIDSLASSTGLLATDRQKIISSIGQLTRLAGDLNREVLLPHLDQIETLLGQLDPVLGSLAQSRTQLGDLAGKLKIFVDQIPKAVYNSTILFYAWLAGTVKPGGGTEPLPVVGTPLLQSLLGPH